jgi:hypothetical protein
MKHIEFHGQNGCRPLYRWAALLVMAAGILAVFVSISASGAHKKKEKRTSYGTGVETGFYPVKYHDTCLIFRPFFVSGDFFSGLNQIDTPAGKQFEKKKQTYRTFPDSIIVDVEVDAIPCDISDPRPPSTDIEIGIVGTLSFGTNWKIGGPQPPLRAVVPIKVEHPYHGPIWDYFLEIPAKDIPLATELSSEVTARNRINIGAFSAHL